jgi:hypothetical protein
MRTATVQQMAAMLANARESAWCKFEVLRVSRGAYVLRFRDGSDSTWVNLQSTREAGAARTFATIEAAVRQSQAVSLMAGHAPNHLWSANPGSMRCMPEIGVTLDTSY